MQCVMDVIIPLRIVKLDPAFLVALQIASGVVSVLEHQVNLPFGSESFPNSLGELQQNVRLGVVNDGMHGVKTQAVEVIFLQPVKRVVNEKISDHATVGTVKVDRVSPWSAMAIGEKLRRISVQVVSFRTEVVVDHVEKNHQALGVSCLNEMLQVFGAAIRGVWRIRQNTVIAPISSAWEIGDRHKFDGGHPKFP